MKLISGLTAAALLLTGTPVFAQGGVPFGAGDQLGVMGLANSGQTGFVTLFKGGPSTRVVTALEGVPAGRVEMVAIQRGKDCDSVRPEIIARSADLVRGISRGVVEMPENRLLDGHYVVVVYASTAPGARMVACGQLYR